VLVFTPICHFIHLLKDLVYPSNNWNWCDKFKSLSHKITCLVDEMVSWPKKTCDLKCKWKLFIIGTVVWFCGPSLPSGPHWRSASCAWWKAYPPSSTLSDCTGSSSSPSSTRAMGTSSFPSPSRLSSSKLKWLKFSRRKERQSGPFSC